MPKSKLKSRRPSQRRPTRKPVAPRDACIDLAERFGQRFRVEHEESYRAQHGRNARVNNPWLKIIPCRNGHICPWGGSRLAAVTHKAGPIARKLAALPGTILWQDAADGTTVLFDVAEFARVAGIMRPRKRRRVNLTPDQRAEIGRRLAQGREYALQPIVEVTPKDRPSVKSDREGLGAVPANTGVFSLFERSEQ